MNGCSMHFLLSAWSREFWQNWRRIKQRASWSFLASRRRLGILRCWDFWSTHLYAVPGEHASTPKPLHENLQLLAVRLSGRQSAHKEFIDKLVRSSALLGGNLPRNSIHPTLNDEKFSVLIGHYDPIFTSVDVVLSFVTRRYQSGLDYWAVNNILSALST